MIAITPTATAEIQRLQNTRPATHLYLTLGSGSCEQFYYILDLVEQWPTAVAEQNIASLIIGIDRQFSKYLANIQIDFAQDLMGGGFRFDNPQALKVCGCGNAFTALPDREDSASSGWNI
jgi:iron-sulfur cluster assembly protein